MQQCKRILDDVAILFVIIKQKRVNQALLYNVVDKMMSWLRNFQSKD